MSDELEFALIAESLRNDGFGRRVVLVDRLRRTFWLLTGGLGLLAMAVMLALTNTMSVVITLAIVSVVIYQVVLLGIREHRREAV